MSTICDVNGWLVYGYRGVADPYGKRSRKMLPMLVGKLGASAARVWCALLGLRDKDGIAHPSTAGIARKLGVSRSTVTRALTRLAHAGLVYSRGKRYIERARRRVWVRSVWGEIDGAFVQVPDATARWMQRSDKASSWGGWRPKSGRRKALETKGKESSDAPIKKTSEKSSTLPTEESQTARADARARGDFEEKPTKTAKFTSSGFIGGKAQFGPRDATRHAWWTRLVREGVVPRLRYGKELPYAVIPLPRKLRAETEIADNAWACAMAYRSYVSRVTRKKSHLFARGKFENSKHYKKLAAWAAYMVGEVDPESQIAPASWIQFRSWTWQGDGPAPLSYVFDLAAVQKAPNRGWCRRELADRWGVMSGVHVWCDDALDLRERYSQLHRACLTAPKWYPDDVVRRLVEHLFPEGLFGLLVQRARIGQSRYQAKLVERVTAGDLSVYTEARS